MSECTQPVQVSVNDEERAKVCSASRAFFEPVLAITSAPAMELPGKYSALVRMACTLFTVFWATEFSSFRAP